MTLCKNSDVGECRVVRTNETFDGKQGFTYFAGISTETVGSQAICMHLLRIPPGGRASVHLHENHETAIYMIAGQSEMLYGDAMEKHLRVVAGDYLYIPAGTPHCPWNPSPDEEAVAILARTDPNEQESVVLRPDLELAVEAYLKSVATSEFPA